VFIRRAESYLMLINEPPGDHVNVAPCFRFYLNFRAALLHTAEPRFKGLGFHSIAFLLRFCGERAAKIGKPEKTVEYQCPARWSVSPNRTY
jgi:hypothetical protein